MRQLSTVAFALVCFFATTVFASEMVNIEDSQKEITGLEGPVSASEGDEYLALDVKSPSPDAIGFCDIIFPGEKSLGNRYCRDGYGVTYDGYFVNNSCYRTRQDARRILRQTRSCRADKRRDFCEFSYPDQRDYSGRYCDNRWGVSYRGYINNNTCYTNIDDALMSWDRTRACDQRPRIGRCRIAFPKVRDDNGRYCPNGFGVMVRRRIVENTCYRNVDDAIRRAREMRRCRRN